MPLAASTHCNLVLYPTGAGGNHCRGIKLVDSLYEKNAPQGLRGMKVEEMRFLTYPAGSGAGAPERPAVRACAP